MSSQVDPAILARHLEALALAAQLVVQDLRSGLADPSHGEPSATVKPATVANDLIEADELAAMLRIDIRTLRRWRHEGRLPKPIRGGRGLRWERRIIEKWIQERAA